LPSNPVGIEQLGQHLASRVATGLPAARLRLNLPGLLVRNGVV
jgi:hypothetical protein